MSSDASFSAPILAWLSGLGVPYKTEDSFSLRCARLCAARGLYGVSRAALGARTEAALDEVLTTLAMPRSQREAFMDAAPGVRHFGFGFDHDGRVARYKAYLDFSDAAEDHRRRHQTPFESSLLFLGFKWAPGGAAPDVMTHYLWYPNMPHRDIQRRARALVAGQPEAERIIEACLALWQAHGRRGRLDFMEVVEPGLARRSFDLKLYSSGLVLGDLMPCLLSAAEGLGVRAEDLRSVIAPSATARLGHVAAGLDRHGSPFITVYHGARVVEPSGTAG